MTGRRPPIAIATAGLVLALVLGACSSDDDPETSEVTDPTEATETSVTQDEEDTDSGCGVTLAEVQANLPAGSGVTESSTPDPGRCNFTWDDGGPRGIDVAVVRGGRASFDVPDGYEPIDGYGDEAYASSTDGRASAFAFVGEDLYAADVVADGTGATAGELRSLALVMLDLALR
jgi:hypothetical protein